MTHPMPVESRDDLVKAGRALNRCIRCDCIACVSGHENHDHICTGEAGCVAQIEERLRKAINFAMVAATRIESDAKRIAELEQLLSDIEALKNTYRADCQTAERAIAEERERCARLAETFSPIGKLKHRGTCLGIATAIRWEGVRDDAILREM